MTHARKKRTFRKYSRTAICRLAIGGYRPELAVAVRNANGENAAEAGIPGKKKAARKPLLMTLKYNWGY
jgi:hypothetical protein